MRFDAIPRELLARCQGAAVAGDGQQTREQAFDELCRLLQPDLYAFLISLLRNHDDADEVLVECLVRVHRHLAKLQDLSKFGGWVVRMAVNQVQTHRARAAIRPTTSLDDSLEVPHERLAGAAQPTPSPRANLERQEFLQEMGDAMASLPPRQREAIVLYEVEQMPIKEIALLLECSEGAIKFNLHEARKKLRERLSHLYRPAARRASEV